MKFLICANYTLGEDTPISLLGSEPLCYCSTIAHDTRKTLLGTPPVTLYVTVPIHRYSVSNVRQEGQRIEGSHTVTVHHTRAHLTHVGAYNGSTHGLCIHTGASRAHSSQLVQLNQLTHKPVATAFLS